MASGAPISSEEKRQALGRVVGSRTFARSEQLRAFLRYVCEAELEGRGSEINEYALGVAVLRRPVDYSPAEDSSVRTRAYDLRNKLRAYYEEEAEDDPIRIEVERGGYVPRFERAAEQPPRLTQPERTEAATAERGMTPQLRALWAPFLETEAPLLLVFDLRLFFHSPATGLVVRDFRVNDPQHCSQSDPLSAFQTRMGETALRETWDYADFGSVHAAFLLGRLLAGSRMDVGMKHSVSLDWQDVWNSNVVFIGNPTLNPIVRALLEQQDFYADDCGVIQNVRPLTGEARSYGSDATHGSGEKHALITRMRGPQSGRQLLFLSGGGAELIWALAESVTNPGRVNELFAPVRLPTGQYPDHFQVVVQATFQANVPVRIRYVTHRLGALP